MSAHAKGTRLWLRPATATRRAVWCIKDGDRRISTDCAERDLEGATRALERHLAARHAATQSARDPTKIPLAEIAVADVLNIYVKETTVARPKELGQRIAALSKFFGVKMLAEITGSACKDYAKQRGSQSAARRELEDLRAAIRHFWARQNEGSTVVSINVPKVQIPLPGKAPPRMKWLSREEAFKLGRAAWRYREVQKGKVTERASRQHVARFLLVGLYTGTRSGAICNAALTPAVGRSYVDLEKGIFYRRGLGDAETNKRQPEVKLPNKLLAHMRRWRRLGLSNSAVIEYEGRPVKSVKKAFARTAADAGLVDVSPHTLRHTAASWAMQKGADIHKTADYLGMSVEVLLGVYAKLHPSNHDEVSDAIRAKPKLRAVSR